MSLSKAKIGDVIYDVVDYQEYTRNPENYNPSYTAIKMPDGFLYPIRKSTDYRPGMYEYWGFDQFVAPYGSETGIYSHQKIIDFDEATCLREIIQCQQRLVSEERSILTTVNNQYVPEIGENDTPEMRALKQAISDKHIDLDQYEHRFGPNYNNDKRLLRKENITYGKFRTICDALDIKATLTLEDAAPDVPNPIGRVITVDLTGAGANSIESEDSK